MLLLAACGGGEAEESPPDAPLQTYKNCRFIRVPPGGLTPEIYYSCRIVTECDHSDLCTDFFVQRFHPECVIGRTTCTACPPGQFFC